MPLIVIQSLLVAYGLTVIEMLLAVYEVVSVCGLFSRTDY